MSLRHTLFALSALAVSASLVSCNNDELTIGSGPTGPVTVGDTVVLSASGKVLTFNRADLSKLVSSLTIKGLSSGERFVGIDVRPQDKLIYGVTNLANIYTLNDATGNVTFKFALKAGAATAATCTSGAPGLYAGLSGTEFAFDFNPAADRLRLASDTRQNLRINVADGATIVDCPITFTGGTGTPKPTAAAYTAATTTTPPTTSLLYVDSGTDMLYAIDASGTDAGTMLANNANNGILRAIGPLGVDVGDINGFDIDAAGTGYAVFTVGGTTGLYTINIGTGAATVRVNFAAGEVLRGIALK